MGDLVSTILVPTEHPPTDIDVKRALLMFDQVYIPDPSDRELFPREWYTHATTPMPVPLFVDRGPVLPLGKMPGYDEVFERTMEDCRRAIEQGSVVLRSQPRPTAGFAIGAVPYPSDLAPASSLIMIVRALASSTDYMREACSGAARAEELMRIDPNSVAPGGLAIEWAPTSQPPIADLNDGAMSADAAAFLRNLAVARIGSLVKSLSICFNNSLHPFSTDSGINTVMSGIQERGQNGLAQLVQNEEHEVLRRATRVERILYDQFLPDVILGSLSIDDVLRLRTKAWGEDGARREAFFRQVRVIATEAADDAAFDASVKGELLAYAKASADFHSELTKVGLVAGSPLIGYAVENQFHVIEHLFRIDSWSTALTAAAVVALGALPKLGPSVVDLWRKGKASSKSAGRVLMTPYASLGVSKR